MLSFQQQAPSTNVGQPQAQQQQQQNDSPQQQQQQQSVQQQQSSQQQQQQQPQQPAQLQQTMRLRDEPPPITPPARASRKRKTPPTTVAEQAQAQPLPPPPPQQPMQHALPPPHTLMHIQGSYAYAVPADYTPGGLPPGAIPGPHPNMAQPPQPQPPQTTSTGRMLSSSKRAEQNRKAQRAFRERRDQHVKALETRSKMLDTALASADEANRRWEQCRALVDQLRIENVALRAALSAQTSASLALPPVISVPSDTNGVVENPTAPVEEQKAAGTAEKDKEGDEIGGSDQKE